MLPQLSTATPADPSPVGTLGVGPTIAPCVCCTLLGPDPDVDRLRDLIASGVGQWEASRRIWGGWTSTQETRAWVREAFLAAFPWLNLTGAAG